MLRILSAAAPRPSRHAREKYRSYSDARSYPGDFHFIPDFFTLPEQRTLLSASLQKLDQTEPRSMQRRRKRLIASSKTSQDTGLIQDVFLPDEYYQFEDGHFDGVIRRFREMHVSSWDDVDSPSLAKALSRLRPLYPTEADTQTHLLHLASDGEIDPHVDNLDASGSWILGISLGADRVLHIEPVKGEDSQDAFDVLLPSGSVYVQKFAHHGPCYAVV
ncbi:hypothetical protein EVG20_g5745 [Dentipellis fragilis]|uniref:Alpha-ketoglutarate-dependent dioxygenase AlkB-like domain-containing protein n=1 Tax=Dentipellis fragilis TaxID=205917 RepID=A0A4Y9YS78_9AGAM|nr:hypothetical protein EVG20_g5745 [Dentipellis fragilis]